MTLTQADISASIKVGRSPSGAWQLLLDGRDISNKVRAGSLRVHNFDSEFGTVDVDMTIVADEVEVDVPEAGVRLVAEFCTCQRDVAARNPLAGEPQA